MVINTAGLGTGTHTLVLESYDQASNGVESTLKTDTVQIVITVPEPTLATFTEDLELVSIVSGVESQWTLPVINPGNTILTEVRFDADPLISQYLKYDRDTNVVSYDGETISSLSGVNLVNIGLNLVNSVGENLYTQLVTVVPDLDVPSTPAPEEAEDNTPTTEDFASGEVEQGTADNSNSAPDAET